MHENKCVTKSIKVLWKYVFYLKQQIYAQKNAFQNTYPYFI